MAARTVAVVAATGRTGMHAVDLLREREGVRVVAIGRSKEKLEAMHGDKAGVELRVADVMDGAKIRDALSGATDVMTCTGHVLGGAPPYSATATSVTDAMKHHGIRKLVFMGSSVVFQPEDKPSWGLHAMLWAVRYLFFAGAVLDDQTSALEDVLKPSSADIDWVYVRPGALEDGKPTECGFAVGDMGEMPVENVRRADVARFMVEQVFDDALVHTAKCMSPVS